MFRDRQDAGIQLANRLLHFQKKSGVIVLGLARGGVTVAYEVAKKLEIPLNVVVPRKIGAPGMQEYAVGAIMEDGKGVFDEFIIQSLQVSQKYLENEINIQKGVARDRLALFRQFAPLPDLKDCTVILVDDGIATGATMLVVIDAMRRSKVNKVVVAIPVAASDSLIKVQQHADDVVCLHNQYDFGSVGRYYQEFKQIDDSEVVELIKRANAHFIEPNQNKEVSMKENIQIKVGKNLFDGELFLPDNAKGLILFVHGSGSNRFSPRNQAVSKYFNQQGLGTLLMDYLTPEEDYIDSETREFRFDIKLLALRLKGFTQWLLKNEKTKSLPLGYFGSSTGAAAAIVGAAEHGSAIKAVVSRGGRPDLATAHLIAVRSPVLLIVGGADNEVLELNKEAFRNLTCEKELKIVPEASHLFEEEGALEEVARLSNTWFQTHL